MMRYALVALTVLASGVATHLSAQSAGHATTAAKPTIVLVHGAWADASGWYDVTRARCEAGADRHRRTLVRRRRHHGSGKGQSQRQVTRLCGGVRTRLE